jgi:hypothetical protein
MQRGANRQLRHPLSPSYFPYVQYRPCNLVI